MSIEDQVAIATPSGQIGFLQRFSDHKSLVRAAVSRLNHKPYTIRDTEQIPMTEYQAMRIEQGDAGPARIPYGANVRLKTLAPGRYVLKVTVTDRNANASASNQVIFDVE